MDCVDMAEEGCERSGEREDPGAGFGGTFIPLFLACLEKAGNRRRIIPSIPKPQRVLFPMLPPVSHLSLCPSHTPVPILITYNSALYKVFIRLTMFVFPLLLIKSRNTGKKYGQVTGFLMVPHLKCILKYVNQ